MSLNTIPEIIEDIRAGKMVILMDDEDRENEGDIIMAATHVRPEDINFMITHARGLVCLTLSQVRCQQLALPLMSDRNEAKFSTNFTVSIEAAEGVTTGISAADRAPFKPLYLRQPNQKTSCSLDIFSLSWHKTAAFYTVQATQKQGATWLA